MTLDQLAREQPELYARIRAEATEMERKRLAGLQALSAPGLEDIIRVAIEGGQQPEAVAISCFEILRSQAAAGKGKEPEKKPGGKEPVDWLKECFKKGQ